MTDFVKVRSISEVGEDGRVIDAHYGQEVPSGLSAEQRKRLREAGAIGPREPEAPAPSAEVRPALDAVGTGPNPDGGEKGVQAPSESPQSPPSSGGGSDLPDGAPNAETADVAELAAFIDSHDLNAPQTVALAGGTKAGAEKVLQAEKTASGGDGRSTVVKPLEKLAGS